MASRKQWSQLSDRNRPAGLEASGHPPVPDALATAPLVPVSHCERDDQVVGSLPVRADGGVHVRSAFDAFAKGDVDTLRESMDQDAVWYVPGRNQFSGDHRGVDAILGFFGKTMGLSGGTLSCARGVCIPRR